MVQDDEAERLTKIKKDGKADNSPALFFLGCFFVCTSFTLCNRAFSTLWIGCDWVISYKAHPEF